MTQVLLVHAVLKTTRAACMHRPPSGFKIKGKLYMHDMHIHVQCTTDWGSGLVLPTSHITKCQKNSQVAKTTDLLLVSPWLMP